MIYTVGSPYTDLAGNCAAGPRRLYAGGGIGYREGRSGFIMADLRTVLSRQESWFGTGTWGVALVLKVPRNNRNHIGIFKGMHPDLHGKHS